MTSHLTRRIIRCIVANEPISHSACHHVRSYASTSRWHRHNLIRHHRAPQVTACRQQRRGIFSFLTQDRQRPIGEGFDPGVGQMMDLERRARLKARLPTADTVERAILAYLRRKSHDPRAIPDTHARLLHQSFLYVVDNMKQEQAGGEGRWSSTPWDKQMTEILHCAAKVLSADVAASPEHVALAQLLYQEGSGRPKSPTATLLRMVVTVLCNQGRPLQARDLLIGQEQIKGSSAIEIDDGSDKASSKNARSVWRHIVHAFVRQNDEVEALQTHKMAAQHGFAEERTLAGSIVQLYAQRQDTGKLKEWFDKWNKATHVDLTSTTAQWDAEALRLALECCNKTEQYDLGNSFVRQVLDGPPVKQLWDEVLVWALVSQKSVDEVDRMIGVLLEVVRNTTGVPDWQLNRRKPDITTINRLVQTAIDSNDPYMAERLVNLGRERNIQPDAQSLVLQIEYRLRVNDVDGALTSYKHLQSKDLTAGEHVSATNKLIVALCKSKRHDYETIMNVVADLADQRATFDADTVKTLSLIHLQRDEFDDLTDLIKTHVPGFSSADRLIIQNAIVDYSVDQETPLAQVWDAYQLLREHFDEMNSEARLQFMRACFRWGRGDLAAQIFHHMRRHSRADTMPSVETYVEALLQCGAVGDGKTLEFLNNQLKLDYNIDVNTRLRNALMLAFTDCGKGRDAYRIWEDIVDSREGPSFSSLHIIFRTCEVTLTGADRASEIWEKLRSKNIDTDAKLWTSYIAATAGQHDKVEGAITILEDAVRGNEVDVDDFMIGSLYNAAASAGQGKIVKDWVKQAYPTIWQSLEKLGMYDDNGRQLLKLDRTLKP